jgi:recombination protein RecT
VLSAVQQNPDLLEADQRSLWNACMRAANDGLLPDGREGTIQVYKTKIKTREGGETWAKLAQWMPMYQGLMKRARNSGDVRVFDAFPLYRNDKFRHWVDDDGEHVLYEPAGMEDEPGALIGAFAFAKDKDGNLYVEPMRKAEIEKIRAASKSKDGPAWTKWPEEMYRKSPIRRIAKRLPFSAEVHDTIQRDPTFEALEAPTIEARAEPVTEAEAPKPKRGRPPKSRMDEFAGEPDSLPTDDEPNGGDPVAPPPAAEVTAAPQEVPHSEPATEADFDAPADDRAAGELAASPRPQQRFWFITAKGEVIDFPSADDFRAHWFSGMEKAPHIKGLNDAWMRNAEPLAEAKAAAPELFATLEAAYQERRKQLNRAHANHNQ